MVPAALMDEGRTALHWFRKAVDWGLAGLPDLDPARDSDLRNLMADQNFLQVRRPRTHTRVHTHTHAPTLPPPRPTRHATPRPTAASAHDALLPEAWRVLERSRCPQLVDELKEKQRALQNQTSFQDGSPPPASFTVHATDSAETAAGTAPLNRSLDTQSWQAHAGGGGGGGGRGHSSAPVGFDQKNPQQIHPQVRPSSPSAARRCPRHSSPRPLFSFLSFLQQCIPTPPSNTVARITSDRGQIMHAPHKMALITSDRGVQCSPAERAATWCRSKSTGTSPRRQHGARTAWSRTHTTSSGTRGLGSAACGRTSCTTVRLRRRREFCHSAAPPSAFSRLFNMDGKGVSAK